MKLKLSLLINLQLAIEKDAPNKTNSTLTNVSGV